MLNKIANERLVEEICKNLGVSPKYMDDLVQEIYLILLEYNQEKLQSIYDKGQFNFFLTRIIKNQYFSKTSPFFKKYRKYYDMVDDNNNVVMYDVEDDRCTDDD
ncbi:MAG: hypothetical protein U0O22_05610 [Acutalibacteraceae bacterium]